MFPSDSPTLPRVFLFPTVSAVFVCVCVCVCVSCHVWKCFDQVRRESALVVALLQGSPLILPSAFLRHFGHLSVHNTLSVGLGKASFRELSVA